MLNDKKFGFAATALLAILIDILAKTVYKLVNN